MKVRVTTKFHDRADYSHVYEVGQVIDFIDEARVRSIVEHNLGVIVEDTAPKEQPQPEKQPQSEEVDNQVINQVPEVSDNEKAESEEDNQKVAEAPKRKYNRKKSKK